MIRRIMLLLCGTLMWGCVPAPSFNDYYIQAKQDLDARMDSALARRARLDSIYRMEIEVKTQAQYDCSTSPCTYAPVIRTDPVADELRRQRYNQEWDAYYLPWKTRWDRLWWGYVFRGWRP